MSINIISASPVDESLQRALATGAVASAEALQAETQVHVPPPPPQHAEPFDSTEAPEFSMGLFVVVVV